jgi:EAL domain-containing protein (putative c-di-GMP-specific phosphodiesterase class I)
MGLQPEIPARPWFEVLLRLPDGSGGVQAAASFLPQASRYGLMPVIDHWVLRQAVTRLGAWRRAHPTANLPWCTINLSRSMLAEANLLPLLQDLLATHDVPAGTLCFDIEESAALANLERAVRVLTALRAAGCAIALEDVGSAMMSFTYLRALPVDFLKIGGHVIRGLGEPMNESIVAAVHGIGRSIGIPTIAKQVESGDAVRKLRDMGIAYAMGFAVGLPESIMDSPEHIFGPGSVG